jgi:hypothetical protein
MHTSRLLDRFKLWPAPQSRVHQDDAALPRILTELIGGMTWE